MEKNKKELKVLVVTLLRKTAYNLKLNKARPFNLKQYKENNAVPSWGGHSFF